MNNNLSRTKKGESSNDYTKLKWKFALENSNIGIWDFDADLNRVFYSDESKKIIGFETEEFGNNPNDWNSRVHPDDKYKYLKDFQNHLNGLKPLYENEHRVLCKDDSYKWIKDVGKIIEWTNDNKPKRIIGTHNDITTQKENELTLKKSLELITNQNKKLINFAHIVTHNLKSHSANFENLFEFYDEADSFTEKEKLVKHIRTVSNSLTKTIKNLNQIVSVQSHKYDNIDNLNVFEYINSALKLHEVEIERFKTIILNVVDDTINLEFNSAYLESIFHNLISNALKYRHPDRDPIIKFQSKITENHIILTVEDNGIGLDMNKYGNDVFNLYRTFHKNKNSEGVGLYLTKNQIESFDGTIEIDSEVNVGSTFTITLPNKKNPV